MEFLYYQYVRSQEDHGGEILSYEYWVEVYASHDFQGV